MIDFVSIVTPNATHYDVAKAFLKAGIHVACEKTLCVTVGQGEERERIAKEKHLMFAVTYTYTGYAMVKLAKELVAAGENGKVVNVNAEYLQDWLIDEIGGGNQTTAKMSVWRTDPAKYGISNCVGDIGNHIPSGHPEGLTYAFANIYHGFMEDVLECANGHCPEKTGDYPTVSDGVAGVKFIHAVVTSNKNASGWTEV